MPIVLDAHAVCKFWDVKLTQVPESREVYSSFFLWLEDTLFHDFLRSIIEPNTHLPLAIGSIIERSRRMRAVVEEE
jgi:hypothetical protein